MEDSISIKEFMRAIRKLPSDEPRDNPGVWYRTQKEHWLGWLSQYHTPGAYGRQVDRTRDARYAYNHIVNPYMLLWLIDAAGIPRDLVESARSAMEGHATLQGQSAAIRRCVPWSEVEAALWGKRRSR